MDDLGSGCAHTIDARIILINITHLLFAGAEIALLASDDDEIAFSFDSATRAVCIRIASFNHLLGLVFPFGFGDEAIDEEAGGGIKDDDGGGGLLCPSC